mmetsp:Transcript_3069/g.9206  ORF Transcript_3069/g.9206 Transcript_3069/m.9206 type:complete len:305 (-) Transcript_3069:4029-4943(-)
MVASMASRSSLEAVSFLKKYDLMFPGKARSTNAASPCAATSQASRCCGSAANVCVSARTARRVNASTSWHTQSDNRARSSLSSVASALRMPYRATHASRTCGAVEASHDFSSVESSRGYASVGCFEVGSLVASSVHADSSAGKSTPRKTRRHVSLLNAAQSRSKTRRSVAIARFRTSRRGSATRWARPRRRGHHSSSWASDPAAAPPSSTLAASSATTASSFFATARAILPVARHFEHSSRRSNAATAVLALSFGAAAKATTQLTNSTKSPNAATRSKWWVATWSKAAYASSATPRSESTAAAE